ncbi:hypothetical protein K435DRAFT_827736 [Dendrothele bispora CBS 962.96]|uniref:Chromatin assembly factor 1 subunit A dimerization domain-containing protein n=1 Tax=Dendrothele bispora (strain CBS 962.96) TaxID=1314807 RepID=A0A4S8MGD7_DENBC|nr:hypothetical protein K435DRAFT_719867 [Dendrothele bispora CBS 962.96]THV01733.1 hypothetical protein K435DRAFT_827736 [Dendrothele bispora CBS 962.96]
MSTPQVEKGPEPADQQVRTTIAELRNGKVVFKQKPHSFEKHSETLQELVKFREMVQDRINNGEAALSEIPDEYKPLIAKLAHESDKTLPALSKHIHSQLLPNDDDEDGRTVSAAASTALPASVIESAVQRVLDRNNYGLQTELGAKAPPASVCVWRWEVKEAYRDWLPKNAQEKATNRLVERIKARNELASHFGSLSETEQATILHLKGASKDGKASAKESKSSSSTQSSTSQDGPKQKARSDENQNPETKGKQKASRPKKTEPDEKIAKAKKEKDAQQTLMANFFTRPKTNGGPSKSTQSAEAGSSSERSEFEKTFRPFVVKKDAQLAAINPFKSKAKPSKGHIASGSMHDVIIVDDDDQVVVDVSKLSTQERIDQILSSLDVKPRHNSRTRFKHFKTQHPLAVKDLLARLSEAEVVGDTALVRSIHDKLANRTLLPVKVFIFAEDSRPGYFGTWTRNSRVVGPRTPFAKDVIDIDYSYDSGEDWEEPSGDADDVMNDEDEEDHETEDRDSDMDDWLVDDDEIEPGTPLNERMGSPSFPDFPSPLSKRKAEKTEDKTSKKRKVVVPLVPFSRGPCWEPEIGKCEESMFNTYRIRLFNDTPFPIDPFTFVSNPDSRKAVSRPAEPIFAVPPLPAHCTEPNTGIVETTAKKIAPPKKTFPQAHLNVLVDKVNTLQANNLTVLVEAIYQELREHNVKKNAIEAKIREIGEKSKEKKFWVIKT